MSERWTRRAFVTSLGLAGAAAALPAGKARAEETQGEVKRRATAGPRVVYLTHHGSFQGSWQAILPIYVEGEVESGVEGGRWPDDWTMPIWTHLFPAAMAKHPRLEIVYVAHALSLYEGLPRGLVAAYAIDDAARKVRQIGQQPLALSAVMPEALAVSPDGQWLLVAASFGGAYNALPLGEDGSIGAVEHALKLTGGGAWRSSALPSDVVFHPSGVAYGADMATDRVDVLSLDADGLAVRERRLFPKGSGPAKCALAPGNDALFSVTRWKPAITRVPLHARTGAMVGDTRWLRLEGYVGGALAVSPAGDRVYVTTQESRPRSVDGDLVGSPTLLSVVDVSRPRRGFRLMEQVRVPEITEARRLLVDGDELLLIGTGGVCALTIGEGAGRLGKSRHVVQHGEFTDAVVQVL